MPSSVPDTPRWGNEGRNRKAMAIDATVALACGEHLRAERWLDVGCGSGEIAFHLASRVAAMTGVDPEPWPDWPRLEVQAGNLRLRQGGFDGEQPPVAEGTMDVIVCNQVYEHVGTPANLIANIGKVLATGGHCYFAGPNLLWPVEPHVFWPLVHWLPRRLAQGIMKALGSRQSASLDAYSTHCWQLRRWFRAAGLEVRWILRERLVAECSLRGWKGLAKVAAVVPQPLYRLIEPVAPGFAYLLRKPAVVVTR